MPLYLFFQVVVAAIVVFFTNQLDCNDVFYGGDGLAPFVSVVEVFDVWAVEEV